MKEEWRDIEGYEGLYQVSNQGRVKSLDRVVKKKKGNGKKVAGRILVPTNARGYDRVHLCKDVKIKQLSVHRLVAEAFIPNPEDKATVNHINGIKDDNRLENLEWCTHSENNRHASKMGLINNNHLKKDYSLVQPNGVVWLLHGIRGFIKHMKIPSHIYQVAKGKGNQAKGWTATKLNLEGIA